MEKLKRNERIAAIIKILGDQPNKIFTLNYFTEKFAAAKSTISEDIMVVKQSMEKMKLGKIQTISGAAGGVKFIPYTTKEQNKQILQSICNHLGEKERILPGGFLYMADIIYSPQMIHQLGEVFASQFNYKEVDYIITVETKGIPLALMVAKAMNLPLVILRRDSKVTEGSTVSINYVSGSSKKMQRMSLARRAIKPNSKVIIIDDFMKAGGTAKGMMDMMKEFDTQVEGIGVLIATREPQEKLVEDYIPLLILEEVEEKSEAVEIYPNPALI
ncbi:pur operon repressor [Clostridium formicaceticum]|uniref:Pur operon repressor n=1 Tax=Clostridium formicaceticum TaxID=1497 RepID=A0AAC9RFJ6_9CLOT|nr:pur operon repressor [Clostridium formicaceticum]AOY75501.1 pur operon repressor [Clostridium formicaceticum]ARE85791.1 Pur operon repressor [Clostridium formicaceticum]